MNSMRHGARYRARVTRRRPAMNTLTRIAPIVALLTSTALVACDKGDDDRDFAESEGVTEGESETSAESETDAASETETSAESETDGEQVVCDAERYGASRACTGGTQFCAFNGETEAYGW